MPSITLMIPALNEEKRIGNTLETVSRVVAGQKDLRAQVLVIDDGSTDATAEIVARFALDHPEVTLVRHPGNLGLGEALRTALRHAQGEKFLIVPGDNDMPSSILGALLRQSPNADMVMCYFLNREERGVARKALSAAFGLIYASAFDCYVQYINGPCIYPTARLRQLNLFSNRFSIVAEINVKLLRQGVSFLEIGGYRQTGLEGSTSLSLRNLAEACATFARLCYVVLWRERAVHRFRPTRVLPTPFRPPLEPRGGTAEGSVAGVILLRADGAALLQLRDDKPEIRDPGIWVVPGGHIEPGEALLDGATREFGEETGYRCARPRPLAVYHSGELGYPGDFNLAFFWDDYDGLQAIECREGRALDFIARHDVGKLPCRPYLGRVLDLALAARSAEAPGTAEPGRRAAELARWLLVGAAFVGPNIGFLYLLVDLLGMKVLLATLLSSELSTVLRYFINERWVFASPRWSWRHIWQFHVANAGAFVVWWFTANLLTYWGLHYLLAATAAVIFSTGFSLASNFFWIWRGRPGRSGIPGAPS